MIKGLHTHRFNDNPEERRFAEEWDRLQPWHLDCLLNGRDAYRPATDREHEVAATVIQWLGSPVGQGFLRDLGYERKVGK